MIELDFRKGDGLLPAIVQDHASGRVLMLAYINADSWERTLETGETSCCWASPSVSQMGIWNFV